MQIRSTFYLFFTEELLPWSKEVQVFSFWVKKPSINALFPQSLPVVFPTPPGFLGKLSLLFHFLSLNFFSNPWNLILSSHLSSLLHQVFETLIFAPIYSHSWTTARGNQRKITVCFIFHLKIKLHFIFNKFHPF